MRNGKKWTKEEETFLIDNWGTLSVSTIAKKLGRTTNAVIVRKDRLGLGAFLQNGDYVTWNQLQHVIGTGNGGGYKMISWVKNRAFPVHTKRVKNNSYMIVYLDEWWVWAKNNLDILDFSKFEENALGKEPDWAKDKRKHDYEKSRKYINAPWTKAEDDKLRILLSKHKYSYDDISKIMRRTNGAIQRRISTLNISDKPIKIDNHTPWSNEEFLEMGNLIKAGYGYDLIAEKIGRSSKACRGRVYQMYLTENLDKVRKYIGSDNFGANKPPKSIKHLNVINTEERIEIRDSITRLTAILEWRFKQQVKDSDFDIFFQKDMCINFCAHCLTTDGCDDCTDFKKIEPQNCKLCGKTFWEKHDNLYCASCRDMRKKQWLRKRFILGNLK